MRTHIIKFLKAVVTILVIGRLNRCYKGLLVMAPLLIGVNIHSLGQVSAQKTETIVWSGQKERVWKHTDRITSAAFSPDGSQVLTSSMDNTAVLRDIKTGNTLQTWRAVWSVFSHDGTQVFTSSGDNSAALLDIRNGITLHKWTLDSKPTRVAFSPDGTMVVIFSVSGTAVIFDTHNGQKIQTWQDYSPLTSAAFSPDNTKVLTGSSPKTGSGSITPSRTGSATGCPSPSRASSLHAGPVSIHQPAQR
jgi:WD40 repeat protein